MPAPDARPVPADVAERTNIIRELLEARGADAALLSTRRNFAWLTIGGRNHVVAGSEEGAAPLLIGRSSATVLAPVNEADRLAADELAGLPIEIERVAWHEPDAFDEAVRHRGHRTVLTDADVEDDLWPIRARLGTLERARMASIGATLTETLDEVIAGAERGVTEAEAAGSLVHRLAADEIGVPVILAAADERIERYRHPLPTGMATFRRLMLVAVAERWGLHVALTRIRDLEPVDGVIAHRMRAVAAVDDAMHAATRPGTTLGDVFAAAQRAYADAGFADAWRQHHQGGLLGYRPRERIATPGDATVLAPGMAVAWNPSLAGVKVEASLLLTAESPSTLRPLTGPDPFHAT